MFGTKLHNKTRKSYCKPERYTAGIQPNSRRQRTVRRRENAADQEE